MLKGRKILEYVKTTCSPSYESRSLSSELEEWWIYLSMEHINFFDCERAVECVNHIVDGVQNTVLPSVDKINKRYLFYIL